MRYGIALPSYGPLASPDNLLRLARRAEELGADSVWVSDHVIAPERVESIYPYDRSENASPAALGRLEHIYDALTALAFVAGATSRVRLGVSVYVVPIRNPILTAKIVASLDDLSKGRLIFGCGVGWLREEFDVLHTPFEKRGARTDEYLRIYKQMWTEDLVTLPGPLYEAPSLRGRPKPHQKPHPPLWIGGNSTAALRRAARFGDGWHPIDLGPDEIRTKAELLRRLCREAGRDPADVGISLRTSLMLRDAEPRPGQWLVGTPKAVRAGVKAYAAAGVVDLVLNLRYARTIQEMIEQLERVAGEVFA